MDMIDIPRIQRLKEKLCGYTFYAIWRNGKDHTIPDALLRAPHCNPTPEDLISDDNESPLHVHISAVLCEENVNGQPLIDPLTEAIKENTLTDKDMQAVTVASNNSFSSNKLPMSVKAFKKLSHQFTVEDRLVIMNGQSDTASLPKSERCNVMARLHASYQRIERTKRRARQTVYWSGIGSEIQNTVQSCTQCQENSSSLPKELLICNPPLSRPFKDVWADLFSHAGKSYLVYVNRSSGWIKISEYRQDPTSQQVISTIRKFFVDAGVPVRMRTDGEPQFSSSKFRQFLKRWVVNHALSSPHYPHFNGHVKAAVKTIKSLVAECTESSNIDREEFCKSHLEWLNAPKEHALSPAEVLYGFPIRSIVPATFKSLSKL